MKECLECKSTNIRFNKSTKSYVCSDCGFTISRTDFFKLLDSQYKGISKTKEEQRKELLKWLTSPKKE